MAAAIATMAFLSVVEGSLPEVVTGNKWLGMQINTVPRIGKVKHSRPKTGNQNIERCKTHVAQ